MGIIEVIEPGLLTTIQDLGRYGYFRHGVPSSGAMDRFALRVANVLVENQEGEACLEITVSGPKLRFHSPALIALTGADLSPVIDDGPVPMWQSVAVPRGSILSFSGPKSGCRAYLAVAGGFDVPRVMDSKSTYLKASIGGLKGRALEAGDTLLTPLPSPPLQIVGRRAPRGLIPYHTGEHLARVVMGPQDDAFTNKGLETFLSSPYTITPQSDRMGYRLEGPKIEHRGTPDIISDGIPFGAIQVAGDGQPIVLMADRGTSGGYTKIATVIGADMGEIAQGLPGDRVWFRAISIEDAHRALREQEAAISRLRELLSMPTVARTFRLVMDGTPYNVSIRATRPALFGDEGKVSGTVSVTSQEGAVHSYQVDAERRKEGRVG